MLSYSSVSPYQQRPDQYTRYLVKRNIDQLVHIGIRQATQFVNTAQTKLKGLNQLKYTVLIGEEAITKHTETIIKALVKIWQMDIEHAQTIIKDIVEILGYHVKIQYVIPLISNILAQQEFKNSTKNTIVLLGLLGHLLINSQGVSQHLEQIIKLVDHYEKLFAENDEGLLSICEISKTLVACVDKTHINQRFIHIMFTVFLDVQSTKTITSANQEAAKKSMSQLSEKANFKTISQLYAYEIGPILERIVKDKQYVNWTKTSKQRFKFDTIVRYCHSQVNRFLGEILQVMQFMINPQSDVEIRMDTLVLMEHMIKIEQLRQSMKPYGHQIMKKILIVSIQWKVGKPQIKIRKAGIINMMALIQAQIINQEQLIDNFKDLLPALKNCMNDDWAPELRLASCEFLEKYLMAVRQNLGDDQLKQLYPALLQRLDDSQDPIRKKVTVAINVFLSCRYLKFSPSTLEYMISSIFVHFDDNSQEIQDCIGTTLKFAAKIDAKQVLTQALTQKKRMKHQERCQQVIQYCEQLLQQMKQQ